MIILDSFIRKAYKKGLRKKILESLLHRDHKRMSDMQLQIIKKIYRSRQIIPAFTKEGKEGLKILIESYIRQIGETVLRKITISFVHRDDI